MPSEWINGLIGGGLIGAAAGLLLLGNGRVLGVSGIVGGLIDDAAQGGRRAPRGRAARDETVERALFVLGVLAAPLVYLALGGGMAVEITAETGLLIGGGLLVGFGARLGSGCTSGHGVCGLARLSRRSFAALATFMATAVLTVAAGALL